MLKCCYREVDGSRIAVIYSVDKDRTSTRESSDLIDILVPKGLELLLPLLFTPDQVASWRVWENALFTESARPHGNFCSMGTNERAHNGEIPGKIRGRIIGGIAGEIIWTA